MQKPLDEILKSAREKNGKTQADIAAECQVSQPTVHAWESGQTRPSPQRWGDVAIAYGVPFETIKRVAISRLLSAARRAS